MTTLDDLLDAADHEAKARRQARRDREREAASTDVARVVDLATGEILNAAAAPLVTCDETPATSATSATSTTTTAATPSLSPEFWQRPVLAHIEQAARARRVAPTAVLGAVLARVAAATPPAYCVPPLVGGTSTLSLFVALVATTGGGKSAPERVAADLVPNLPPGVDSQLLGSGEGLVKAYLELVDVIDDNGKKVRRNKQIRHGVMFLLDEGRVLGEMSKRSGSTILPTLCSAWTGAALGQANAADETHRKLAAGAYACGLLAAFQPSRAVGLFDDVDGGTPGRFLYLPTADVDAPATPPEWPGRLDWSPPAVMRIGDTVTPTPLEYPPDVRAEVDERRLALLRGELVVEPLDAHRDLLRLKVAGVLAVLDGRRTVTLDDWQLASELVGLSDRVRQSILDTASREARRREWESNERAARREVVVEVTLERRALDAMARSMANRAHRVGGTMTRRELHQTTRAKWRALASIDDALDQALAEGWLVSDGDGFRAGSSRPST